MFSSKHQGGGLPFVEKTGVNPIISLQRYYNTEQAHETRKISIRMEEEEEEEEKVAEEPQEETVDWDQDPLRLCLQEAPSTPTLPPPVILPSELYEPAQENICNDEKAPPPAWLYERDPELATSMTSFDTETITDETWEAIFHPLSTFKHKKGELEYLAWNPSNLPAAAARVAYRVMHARAFAPESDAIVSDVEPTIPNILPSPPLKPSPVLSQELKNEITVEDQGYYFDMLKNIRADSQPSPTSSLPPRIAKRSLLDMIITKKQDVSQYMMEEETPVTTQAMMKDPETCSDEKNMERFWTEKRLFWFGFLCPLLWFYGSYYIRAARRNSKDPTNLVWQRKCRLASIYFSVIVSVVVLVAAVKAAGSAGVRQAQSGSIRAVIAN
ncbi:hypothetical protein INT47_000847 [Mucor saturninus]|uniref:Uncharacterized protein n=1 Tax=Mucor saturninus TaxID=64648 RepID=A0A8H7RR20_9FUNG|nr:hypothetical protein INT47_000847 [Mucor saturninus]